AAAEAGHRAYFTTAADLAARCHKAALEGRWATMMRFYAGPRLLAIDELLSQERAVLLARSVTSSTAGRSSLGSGLGAVLDGDGVAVWATKVNIRPNGSSVGVAAIDTFNGCQLVVQGLGVVGVQPERDAEAGSWGGGV
ncbi:MAG TPA: hypothetical protein VES60_14390, partial [Nakamurella sp.]|nr:hypothetical protein [Nakamurella sp.]